MPAGEVAPRGGRRVLLVAVFLIGAAANGRGHAARTPRKVAELRSDSPVHSVALSHDGSTAIVGGALGVGFWDRDTGKLRSRLRHFEGAVVALALSVDGSLLAAGSYGRVQIVQTAGQKVTRNWRCGGFLNSLSLSADKSRLLVGTDTGVEVRSLGTGRLLRKLSTPSAWFHSTDLSPNGRLIARAAHPSRSEAYEAELWDVSGGTLRQRLKGHVYSINAVAFSPSGRQLATGARDGSVRLWDLATGRLRLKVPASGGQSLAVAFSPDGKVLASADFDGVVRAWRTGSGSLEWQVAGRAEAGQLVGFSANGRYVATLTSVNTVSIWEVI